MVSQAVLPLTKLSGLAVGKGLPSDRGPRGPPGLRRQRQRLRRASGARGLQRQAEGGDEQGGQEGVLFLFIFESYYIYIYIILYIIYKIISY